MLWMLMMAAVGPSAAEITALETAVAARGHTVSARKENHRFDLAPRVQARNVQCVEQPKGRYFCSFESRNSTGPFEADYGPWTTRHEIMVKDGLGGWRIAPQAPAGPGG
jgi:hypothetical protein